MNRDILLLFLSTVGKDNKTGLPRETEYADIGVCRTTNESAVRYLVYQGHKLDRLFAFASQTVREEPVASDVIPTTHEKYFCEQVQGVIPDIDARYVGMPYDEDGDIKTTMDCAVAMAERIGDYVRSLPDGDTVTLHVDITGGLRHSNMMMIALTRLIEYSGVRVGDILYSNYTAKERRVERVNEIYAMFDLIAGATEFVNYGSVKALAEYFLPRQPSVNLANLVAVMRDFSEAVKLCHVAQLEDASKELIKAIRDFSASSKVAPTERLMAQLESRIVRDYRTLLRGGNISIELIEWCLERDYLQQALTLYVERVPEVLLDTGILTLMPDLHQMIDRLRQSKHPEQGLGFFFITMLLNKDVKRNMATLSPVVARYCTAVDNSKMDIRQQELQKIYKDLAATLKRNSLSYAEASAQVEKILTDDEAVPGIGPSFVAVNRDRAERLLAKIFHWSTNLEELESTALEEDDDYRALANKVCARRGRDMVEFATGSGSQKMAAIRKYLTNDMDKRDMSELFTPIVQRYDALLLALIHEGYAVLHTDVAMLTQILADYRILKNERNSSNHARYDAVAMTADDLRRRLRQAIERIRAAMPTQPVATVE